MLIIAYDGTAYCGFQVQPNGVTVQELVNRALSDLTGEEIRTIGASRTDAGVHARGNVVVFDTQARMPGDKYSYALNPRLPDDIKVQLSREVAPDFHPRYTDTVKTYEYRILNRRMPDPTRRLNTLFQYFRLDADRMQAAAEYLVGTHDFRSFQASGETNPDKETVRTIYHASVRRGSDEDGNEDLLTFRITGNGFLYNMVRILAGTLIEIGRGKMEPEQMNEIIAARDRAAAGPTAPPQGLTLVDIRYPQWEPDFGMPQPAADGTK
jgi:tRNA pseudouridine38-40 synthase